MNRKVGETASVPRSVSFPNEQWEEVQQISSELHTGCTEYFRALHMFFMENKFNNDVVDGVKRHLKEVKRYRNQKSKRNLKNIDNINEPDIDIGVLLAMFNGDKK